MKWLRCPTILRLLDQDAMPLQFSQLRRGGGVIKLAGKVLRVRRPNCARCLGLAD